MNEENKWTVQAVDLTATERLGKYTIEVFLYGK